MKFALALFLIVSLFAISSEASIGKVATFPVRHPKETGHAVKKAAQKSAHVAKKSALVAKKILY